jgi:hypothetical protein
MMRRPRNQQRVSIRSPAAVIPQLAKHIDVADLPPPERRRLIEAAVLLNGIIARCRGPELASGIAELLHLPPEEVRKIALKYFDCRLFLQDALRARLVYLALHAPAGQTRSFLKLIPKVDERISSAFDALLSRHPELRRCINNAKANFKRNPQETLDHVLGDTSDSRVQLSGGGHVLAMFEGLADAQLSTWSREERQRFANAIAGLDPEQAREDVNSMFGDLGLALSGDRWAKFFLKEQNLWFIATRANGVRCFRVPRSLFNKDAWGKTVSSAKGGTSPVGGKSLFPENWGRDEIVDAIVAVLEHPEPFLLRPHLGSSTPSFFLRSNVNGVDVEVGINGDSVGTAFPSWRQYRPDTIGQAYEQWFDKHTSLKDWVNERAKEEPLLSKVSVPDGVVQSYLGKMPAGLSASEWERVRRWLNPRFLSEARVLLFVAPLQLTIFEWMERSRVVQELEGVEGPVR